VTDPDPGEWFEITRRALGDRFRLDRLVATSPERVLFEAFDEVLKRRVSLRVNPQTDEASRAWFMREAEALGQLDHPAVGHVYEAGVVGDLAYRIGNWVDGEGLLEAIGRGPRLIPTVLAMARDLPARWSTPICRIIVRRIAPMSVLVSSGGRE
jgi:hypothetical protein